MDNASLLAKQAEIEAIKTEVQGMIALNQHRLSQGESIAYVDDAFQEKADELRGVATWIMHIG